jgi:ABC-type uncharacterized transport system substrate-binding protein
VNRREFITLLGGAAVAWPLVGRAQAQQLAMPVIGFLDVVERSNRLAEFNRGLVEIGYVEGQNVAIEFRSAGNRYDRFPQLVAELVQRNVGVIATPFTPAALAAKAATTTVSIVFTTAADPVRVGLVASLARPGGNATGINFYVGELTAKRLELLRTLVPAAVRVAVLVNPDDPISAAVLSDMEPAARTMELQIQVLKASTIHGINAAFASLKHERPDALFVGPDPFFVSRRMQITHLASRHALPAAYSVRDFVEAGGLMSYGTNIADAWRHIGDYVGRILKGTKPKDLPVAQASKFETGHQR